MSMFKIFGYIALAVVVVSFMPSATEAALLTDAEMQKAVRNGVSWLVYAQEPNGHFKYEYAPYEGIYRHGDNIVRQAGALFALGEVERMDEGSAYALEVPMKRAIDYFASLSVSGTYGGKTFKCVKEAKSATCKLGTTALAYIGLSDFLKEYPSYTKKYGALRGDYLAYLLAMKKEETGFREYYSPTARAQREDETSFSNGEALLALVRAYEGAPKDKELKRVIGDTFVYLDTKAPFDSGLYLWAMAGLRDLHTLAPDPRYVVYAKRYTAWRLADRAMYIASPKNTCAYIEGLASAHTLLNPSATPAERAVLEGTIDTMLTKVLWLQIQPANLYRFITDATGSRLAKLLEPARAEGGFLTGQASADLTQRIDYTQHCVSAYAQTLVDIRGESLQARPLE